MSEKCLQRSRVAARRDAVNGARMKFLAARPAPETCARALGKLPRSVNEAMALINAGAKDPLSANDVYIHYAEAANDNFLDDRYMFMAESTLRNIARAAQSGVAFMNSHATGGLSAPAQLPFGKTFAGRYEEVIQESGSVRRRAIVGVYMLRGIAPNGAAGPTTDDLHAQIQAGVLTDVSVGLYGGTAICDICAEDLEVCPHIPGSTAELEQEHIDAQLERGVPGGRASYTYEGGMCHEVSAVYEGAVPGAGFSKAVSNLRHLTSEQRAELAESFSALINGLETFERKDMAEKIKAMEDEEEKDKELAPEEEEDEQEPSDGDDPEPDPEDSEEDEEEKDAAPEDDEEDPDDEEEEDDEEEKAYAGSVLERALRSIGDAAVKAFRKSSARKFTKAQLDALAPIVRAASVGGEIGYDALEAFVEASPDLTEIFGDRSKPLEAKVLPPAGGVVNARVEVEQRLEARGVTRQSHPKTFYQEYFKEARAISNDRK